jgi:predicted DNA-binding transcriptional regulator AlpA
MSIDVQELAREIACRMAPDALLSPEDVGALLGCSGRYVTEQYVLTPSFPKAIRLRGPAGRQGQPRWQRSDIMEWVAAHRDNGNRRGPRREN